MSWNLLLTLSLLLAPGVAAGNLRGGNRNVQAPPTPLSSRADALTQQRQVRDRDECCIDLKRV
jgi:hypothetical protein